MIGQLLNRFAAGTPAAPTDPCAGGGFLGFPSWYTYLPKTVDANGVCSPAIKSLSDIWLIVAAIVEILLRVAALAAIAMIIYGGVLYVMSRGNPDKAQQARGTIINAVIGLGLAVSAAALVTFVAGQFTK